MLFLLAKGFKAVYQLYANNKRVTIAIISRNSKKIIELGISNPSKNSWIMKNELNKNTYKQFFLKNDSLANDLKNKSFFSISFHRNHICTNKYMKIK